MENTIGGYLKACLAERKMSQKELADKIGVTKAAVSMYISGATNPSVETWKKISSALDIPPEDLNKAITTIIINEQLSKEAKVRNAVISFYGKLAWEIVEKIGLMTNEGRRKLLERAEELLEIKRYNASAKEYEADSAKDRYEYYGYNPNEEDGK